jgi:hypothetical protein
MMPFARFSSFKEMNIKGASCQRVCIPENSLTGRLHVTLRISCDNRQYHSLNAIVAQFKKLPICS